MKIISVLLVLQALILNNVALAEVTQQKWPKTSADSIKNLNLRELALPSEVKNIGKSSGAIYYSPSVKGKVLIPVNFWGEVSRTGLHFIPIDTSLVKGLSLAGGPKTSGMLKTIQLKRVINNKITTLTFDLEDGGNSQAYYEKLRSGDTVFIQKDNFHENRAYYTSLIGVFSTILSTIIIYNQVKQLP